MRRRLFTLLSAASLLVCVAAVGMRVVLAGQHVARTSDTRRTAGEHFRSVRTEFVANERGVYVQKVNQVRLPRSVRRETEWSASTDAAAVERLLPPSIERTEVRWDVGQGPWPPSGRSPSGNDYTYRGSDRIWAVDYAQCFPWALVLPLIWTLRRLRDHFAERERRAVGTCAACGYDLRATPGRCPECGAIVSASNQGDVVEPKCPPLPSPPYSGERVRVRGRA